jgi:hypothetical protein
MALRRGFYSSRSEGCCGPWNSISGRSSAETEEEVKKCDCQFMMLNPSFNMPEITEQIFTTSDMSMVSSLWSLHPFVFRGPNWKSPRSTLLTEVLSIHLLEF